VEVINPPVGGSNESALTAEVMSEETSTYFN